MNKSFLLGLVIIAATVTGSTYAQNPRNLKQEFRTPIRAAAIVTSPSNHAAFLNGSSKIKAVPQTSDVFLMNISLSAGQKSLLQTFKSPMNTLMSANTQHDPALPAHVELGMNNVPVFDQGMHGTCVTFANTAALDALLGKGDYISQLCSLEIGKYLETRSYLPSGWDGSFGPLILDRIREFGIVSMDNQTNKLCGGVKQYPKDDMNNIGNPMPLEEYAQMSEDINPDLYWYSLVTPYERFTSEWENSKQADNLLKNVKSTLAAKDAKANIRLTFGVILPVNHCSAGACATYHQTSDTWAITKAIRDDQDPSFGGHEMVITGYDDNAIAVDNEGVQHQGLLIIRNSWSDKHGDNGDYYMTYDFFKHFVMEVQEVGKYAY